MIAISLRENPPLKYGNISTLLQGKYMAAQYIIRATGYTTLQHTLVGLAFGRDMIHLFSSKINWQQLLQQKQQTIN